MNKYTPPKPIPILEILPGEDIDDEILIDVHPKPKFEMDEK